MQNICHIRKPYFPIIRVIKKPVAAKICPSLKFSSKIRKNSFKPPSGFAKPAIYRRFFITRAPPIHALQQNPMTKNVIPSQKARKRRETYKIPHKSNSMFAEKSKLRKIREQKTFLPKKTNIKLPDPRQLYSVKIIANPFLHAFFCLCRFFVPLLKR